MGKVFCGRVGQCGKVWDNWVLCQIRVLILLPTRYVMSNPRPLLDIKFHFREWGRGEVWDNVGIGCGIMWV